MKELTNNPTGDFSRGQAQTEAEVAATQGVHDHAAWERQAAEAAARAQAACAKATRSQRGAA